MCYPTSIPEQTISPPPSGVALGEGFPPDNQKFIKPTVIGIQAPNFMDLVMYLPPSLPEQIIPLPLSGVALKGGRGRPPLSPENQNFIKPTVFEIQTPNFIFKVVYYPAPIPEQIIPLPTSGVAQGG